MATAGEDDLTCQECRYRDYLGRCRLHPQVVIYPPEDDNPAIWDFPPATLRCGQFKEHQ